MVSTLVFVRTKYSSELLCDKERSTIQGLIGFIENTSKRLENIRDVDDNEKIVKKISGLTAS